VTFAPDLAESAGPSLVESPTPQVVVRRSRRSTTMQLPLGSLTQRDHRSAAACRGCGSPHVTRLSMSLTDGTQVKFTSCHRCEDRMWEPASGELSVDGVLQRARKN
jgi:hypothetical protein